MGGGKYSTKHTKKMGMDAEKSFEKILNEYNISYSNATKTEEKTEHWDFKILDNLKKNGKNETKDNINLKKGKYEIKSAKAKSRGMEKDYNIIYIEFKSVGGNKGWIFGDADYIAFEVPEGFLIFPRIKLLKYISCMYEFLSHSDKSGNIGTLYSRSNRKDLVGIFPKQLLMIGVEHIILKKNY